MLPMQCLCFSNGPLLPILFGLDQTGNVPCDPSPPPFMTVKENPMCLQPHGSITLCEYMTTCCVLGYMFKLHASQGHLTNGSRLQDKYYVDHVSVHG